VSGQRSNLSLRHIAPLAAVLATLGPGAAQAASLSPDVPPPGPSLTPDPVPAAHHATVTRRSPSVRVAPRRLVAVAAPSPGSSTAVSAPAPRAQVERGTNQHVRHDPPVRVVDVVPLRVDVHRGLGAIAASVRDDLRLVLAAAALLAAVTAAAAGAALAHVARRQA
jgi:hypothetical protein